MMRLDKYLKVSRLIKRRTVANEVADAGRMMPPKSTWFEPKLLSGLFVHSLSTDGKKA